MAEHHFAVLMLKVLIQPQARTGLGQDGGERGLPHLKRVAAEVVAVQFDQVEGVQEDAGVIAPVADAVEAWHLVIVAAYRLAVDDAGTPQDRRAGIGRRKSFRNGEERRPRDDRTFGSEVRRPCEG
jgi:hypothetical protein